MALTQAAAEVRLAKEEGEIFDRAKTEFLANISHELKTPLNAVIGFSELMAAETLGPIGTPQYKEYAEQIRDSGLYLVDIVNDLSKEPWIVKCHLGANQLSLDFSIELRPQLVSWGDDDCQGAFSLLATHRYHLTCGHRLILNRFLRQMLDHIW